MKRWAEIIYIGTCIKLIKQRGLNVLEEETAHLRHTRSELCILSTKRFLSKNSQDSVPTAPETVVVEVRGAWRCVELLPKAVKSDDVQLPSHPFTL